MKKIMIIVFCFCLFFTYEQKVNAQNSILSDQSTIIGNINAGSILTFSTSSIERMRIDNNGLLGLGTSNPTRLLELQTSSTGITNNLLSILTTGDGGKGMLFGLNTTNRFIYWRLNDAGDYGFQIQGLNGSTILLEISNTGIVKYPAILFANLGTPGNGSFAYCSDCTIANPCAGGGTGAFAKRLNGIWVCN